MEFDAGIPMSRASAVTDGTSLSSSPQRPPFNHHDTMWSMDMRANEMMEAGPYPERPGEPDCSYFIRTGLCRFGATCRYNHPPNRQLAIVAARMTGEFPKRIGQPECQFYLKTGTCKFGATCKFHHPREKAGIEGRVSLNAFGYPLRANEIECVYYLRTGRCKFGSTCKFHHPQPSSMMVSVPGSPIYQSISSPTTPGQQSYSGIANWPLTRASFVPSPRWQVPSSYAPLIVPSGAVSVPGWNSYTGQFVSASSSETLQQGNSEMYGSSQQNEPINPGPQGTYARYRPGSIPIGFCALQRDNVFPERPGQPECQFYMKTGDCKFGAVCRFHHPRERLIPPPDCLLSPIGLPLRPGEPLCVFYSRYGICKFGPSCKFDHPMEIFTYNLGISSSLDAPIVRRLLGSTSGSASMGLAEGLVEAAPSTKTRRLMLPEARKMPSGDSDINIEG